MNLPPDTETAAIIGQTGEIWKQWGWEVIEREGFVKPNRFGYSPDGYVLQIQARPDRSQPPSLIGSSPCFPGNRRTDAVDRPPLIRQGSRPRLLCESRAPVDAPNDA
ncbi:Uncharacterised protein [Mycolicibacterium phlei]|uniref:hypothetical protein n=1 Tax=Mycolicibacterium phlei TaxID=1771 RepID=UPI00078C3608|nr:hypothetical protein [Mycolicibacterium phlei]AMO61870.1 hypothetical protein MPHLCCUG_03065 [Mycolicibacterium phlei]STZ19445.1 Uncharacterised protein [Mycolicibacterium phlei]VEG09976.1 Uncharacterised protein [Mycobacteroides chelonae]